jgi:hypothetical protein
VKKKVKIRKEVTFEVITFIRFGGRQRVLIVELVEMHELILFGMIFIGLDISLGIGIDFPIFGHN